MQNYLRQNHVTPTLKNRIIKYLENWSKTKKGLIHEESTCLKQLSVELKRELTHETRSNQLLTHPLFNKLNKDSKATMLLLFEDAVTEQYFAEYEVIFNFSEHAQNV